MVPASKTFLTVSSLLAMSLFVGCKTHTESDALIGAGAGVTAGALIGGPVGAGVGGAVGAGSGALIGSVQDKEEKEDGAD
ncbi:MAG: glycine zipper domain-containing protein [Planctomycetota bacterium]|nr:glycine zipper domain-containing protein [Planctomycetota bacterium]